MNILKFAVQPSFISMIYNVREILTCQGCGGGRAQNVGGAVRWERVELRFSSDVNGINNIFII